MTGREKDLKARLMATFQSETQDHLQAISTHLLALDQEPARPGKALENILRAVHTLKGAARAVDLQHVESFCHALESVLRPLSQDPAALTPAVRDLLNAAAERLARILPGGAGDPEADAFVQHLGDWASRVAGPAATAPSPDTPPASGASPPGPAPWGQPRGDPPVSAQEPWHGQPADTLRIAREQLDDLLEHAEELLAARLAAAERAREAAHLAAAFTQYPDRESGASSPEARSLAQQARALSEHLQADARWLARATTALHDAARQLRLSPAGTVLEGLPLMARNLATAAGKEVDLILEGGEVALDRRALESVKDPLLHLVRNAVVHGIESPADRARAGKPPRGKVTIRVVSLEDGRVAIEVTDDGRGFDLEQLRAAAVAAQILPADTAAALSDAQALELVYHSGLTTAPEVTSLSGRGLGLAIVRDRLDRLGGTIALDNRPGAGAAIRMTVPATIATLQGVLVRAAGRLWLLPLGAVARVVRWCPAPASGSAAFPALAWHGRQLPVVALEALLGLAAPDRAPDPPRARPCVIAQHGDRLLALLVDEVLGDREVIVKELPPQLSQVRCVASAGLLGSGELVLVLRPADLLAPAATPAAPPAATETTAIAAAASPAGGPDAAHGPGVLVVDDSPSARAYHRQLLEGAGYRVREAPDGLTAWAMLKTEGADLLLSDVDMPGLDGLALVARVRADAALRHLPIILVSALESDTNREQGLAAGASAYLPKSRLEPDALLALVRQLTESRGGAPSAGSGG